MNDESDKKEDDISFEEEMENTGVDHKKKIDQLKLKLKEAEEKASKHLDNWQRDKAEFINVRRRDEAAQQEFLKFANEKLILDILPILDSFDLAANHTHSTDSDEFGRGIEQIKSQLIKILEKNGVRKFSPIDEEFDPSRAQAIGVVPAKESTDENKVMEVIQAGYELNGKVIRPAMVKVGEK